MLIWVDAVLAHAVEDCAFDGLVWREYRLLLNVCEPQSFARRYDAFVFLYGETITNTGFELTLLRWLGKRTVVVFVGSDARPPYIDGGWLL